MATKTNLSNRGIKTIYCVHPLRVPNTTTTLSVGMGGVLEIRASSVGAYVLTKHAEVLVPWANVAQMVLEPEVAE